VKTGDTITAQATPPGRGGVGIVRISGSSSFSIAEKILGKKIKAREAVFCDFLDGENKIIDRGLAIYFSAPNSFTGEDVLELQGHGGQVVMDLLLQRVLELGARLAEPGEFTQRAFLNKKLDLTQVEAIADLINASTADAARNAMRSLGGEFSRKVDELTKSLMELRAKVEASIDFVEEGDVSSAASENIKTDVNNLLLKIKNLQGVAKQGVIVQEGITVVITGNVNAGKSSLLNLLSGEDRAIVTNIPGTTRDVLRAHVQLDGLLVNLLDTAGLHDKPDLIEEEGIHRARKEIKKADHILVVVDASLSNKRDPKGEIKNFAEFVPGGGRVTVLYNKVDLTGDNAKAEKIDGIDCVFFSAKTGAGVDLLKKHLKTSAGMYTIEQGFSARRRHLNALGRAEKHLQNIGEPLEVWAEELKEAQNILGEVTGKVTTEDILDKIFSEFCVGK